MVDQPGPYDHLTKDQLEAALSVSKDHLLRAQQALESTRQTVRHLEVDVAAYESEREKLQAAYDSFDSRYTAHPEYMAYIDRFREERIHLLHSKSDIVQSLGVVLEILNTPEALPILSKNQAESIAYLFAKHGVLRIQLAFDPYRSVKIFMTKERKYYIFYTEANIALHSLYAKFPPMNSDQYTIDPDFFVLEVDAAISTPVARAVAIIIDHDQQMIHAKAKMAYYEAADQERVTVILKQVLSALNHSDICIGNLVVRRNPKVKVSY